MRDQTKAGAAVVGRSVTAGTLRDRPVSGGGPPVRAGGRHGGGSRRRTARPRPARPGTAPVVAGPARTCRPVCRAAPVGAARRSVRRSAAAPAVSALRIRVRRAVAGVALAAGVAVAVAGLGLLGGGAAQWRADAAGAVAVTVGAERTVWEVARRSAPGADGAELAVLVERIVTENSLGSVRLRPGQVLRVTVG